MSPALLVLLALQPGPSAELLDFTAVWCGPCQQMSPIVSRLQREGLPVRQIDVDRDKALASRFKITGIPAFVLVVEGREVGRLVGAQSEANLRQLLLKIPSPPPTAVASAEPPPRKSVFAWPFGSKKEAAQPPSFPQSPEEPSERPEYRAQDPASEAPSPSPAAVGTAPPAARDPIETAVRIRVKDARGTDFGSGTVVASREGKALVLTCWHIFREFGPDAAVDVDLFPNGPQSPPQTLSAKLITSDEQADVALIAITGCGVIPVSPLAAEDQFPKQGDHVFSVGCGNGEPPSKLQHTVTRINPYKGPGTTECTEMPVVGRSGGGLFDRNGKVIGVCFAAARQDKTGVYVGPGEVHKLIRSANLAALIPAPGIAYVGTETPEEPEQPAAPSRPAPDNVFAATIGAAAAAAPAGERAGEARPRFEPSGSDNTDMIAALEAGAEVTCIVRPANGPSEVFVINRASKRFVKYLRGELDAQPVETSMRVETPAPKAMCEPAPYALLAAAHVPAAGVALLSRVFHNHGRF